MSETAWLYAVVSSDRQADTLADQETWARATCAANGWPLERVFSATASGKRGVRKLLVSLVAELRSTPKERRPARVLMLRLDRIGRGSIVESQVALREIAQLGVTVHTRDGGDQRLEGAMDELIAAAKFAVASFENDVRREKSLAFHARKRAAGEWPSHAPYGFVLIDKRLAIYEPEAAVVREVFERRIAGHGYQRIAMSSAAVAPGKMRPNGERRPMVWGVSTVTTMLSRTVYRGTIVTEALWDAAAATRGSMLGRKAPRWPWPLRGAVRCTCGALLVGEASGREGARTRYYVCRRFNCHPGAKRFPHHNATRMEAQFLTLLGMLEASPELAGFRPPKRRGPGSVDALRRRRAEIGRERADLERRRARAWELAEDGTIPKADLADRLLSMTSEGERLAAAGAEIDRAIAATENATASYRTASDLLREAATVWASLPTDGRQRLARAVANALGGLWADPKRPGVLLRQPEPPGDDSQRGFDTLRNVDMAQRKADDSITKKFIQSITE